MSPKTREQYQWACRQIAGGLGGIRIDRLERTDVAAWLDHLAREGRLSRQSIVACRMVLRAILADAVDEGLLRRSPAARMPMPRHVAKPGLQREVQAWSEADVRTFLAVVAGHKWEAPLRLTVLFGPRRSEVLALRWDDIDVGESTIVIDEGLVKVGGRYVWTDTKSARSKRTIPVDPTTMRAFVRHRALQARARLAVGPAWRDETLVVASAVGGPVDPRNFDQDLDIVMRGAGLPRLTSHGLRHTAATHMVRRAADLGELRAVADILGHGPDMLIKTYAHTLPDSLRRVADRLTAF